MLLITEAAQFSPFTVFLLICTIPDTSHFTKMIEGEKNFSKNIHLFSSVLWSSGFVCSRKKTFPPLWIRNEYMWFLNQSFSIRTIKLCLQTDLYGDRLMAWDQHCFFVLQKQWSALLNQASSTNVKNKAQAYIFFPLQYVRHCWFHQWETVFFEEGNPFFTNQSQNTLQFDHFPFTTGKRWYFLQNSSMRSHASSIFSAGIVSTTLK